MVCRHASIVCLILIGLSFVCHPEVLFAGSDGHQPNPGLPEPMMFDLVGPLGAEHGHLEANVLLQLPIGEDRDFSWAPEIEYAFQDGYAVELELDIGPLDISGVGATDIGATDIQGYKIAFQGTLGTALDKQLIYGWQAINTYEVERKAVGMDALLIAGYHINPQWSIVAMNGIRHTDVTGGGRVTGLMNFNVFHKTSARMTLGLESDFEFPHEDHRRLLLMPQLHFKTSANATAQFGIGVESLERGAYHPVLGMRLIYVF